MPPQPARRTQAALHSALSTQYSQTHSSKGIFGDFVFFSGFVTTVIILPLPPNHTRLLTLKVLDLHRHVLERIRITLEEDVERFVADAGLAGFEACILHFFLIKALWETSVNAARVVRGASDNRYLGF